MKGVGNGVEETVGIIDRPCGLGHFREAGEYNQPVLGVELSDDLLAQHQQPNRELRTSLRQQPFIVGMRHAFVHARNLSIVLFEVCLCVFIR